MAGWLYQPFAPQAAAASGAITGSTSFSFTNSGVLTGSGALVGATSFAFTPVGALTGSGALAGTSALTFSGAGVLSGFVALTGQSALTFTADGVLTGSGALSGTSAPSFFTADGALTGSGALVGLCSFAFTVDGSLAAGLVGTSAFAFTGTGALTGSGALVGVCSFAFTAAVAAPEVPAVPIDTGGDRGINLRGRQPEPKRPKPRPPLPAPARFQLRTRQALQWSRIVLDDLTTFRLETEQRQMGCVMKMTAMQVHTEVPVGPRFDAYRMRAESASAGNEVRIVVEVE